METVLHFLQIQAIANWGFVTWDVLCFFVHQHAKTWLKVQWSQVYSFPLKHVNEIGIHSLTMCHRNYLSISIRHIWLEKLSYISNWQFKILIYIQPKKYNEISYVISSWHQNMFVHGRRLFFIFNLFFVNMLLQNII